MGNECSTGWYTPSPSLSRLSSRDGSFVSRKRRQHWDSQASVDNQIFHDILAWQEAEENAEAEQSVPTQRKRSVKKVKYEMFDDSGSRVPVSPKSTSWYRLYVSHPNVDNPKFHKQFRRRFRLPHHKFVELVNIFKEATNEDGSLSFRRWMSKDAVGLESSPIELMILGALRYLGRGWTFDDIEEATVIDEETHRQFFHHFITFGAEVLFNKWVVAPTTAEEAEPHMHEMRLAGMTGGLASSDASHIIWERCSFKHRQAHKGFKLSCTARTYNITVNHRRRILCSTQGHPARWNDKTLVLYDDWVRGVYEGKYLSETEFTLFEHDDTSGEIVERKYRGVWILVDNGYLDWPTTVPPIKRTFDQREIRWSQWLESMRKDVECTFGILKGRWRILKAGVRLHSADAVDRVWKTCCALHNWLLEADGLDNEWENGVSSEWEGELGEYGDDEFGEFVPAAIANLRNPAERRSYDVSGMSVGNDVNLSPVVQEEVRNENLLGWEDSNGVRIVRKMSLACFRAKLIEHFDILWQRNHLVWPQRNNVPRPTYP